QAEDGIRDFHVTGVQTCALPISVPLGRTSLPPLPMPSMASRSNWRWFSSKPSHTASTIGCPNTSANWLQSLREQRLKITYCAARSEERRVGKEWRWRPSLVSVLQ